MRFSDAHYSTDVYFRAIFNPVRVMMSLRDDRGLMLRLCSTGTSAKLLTIFMTLTS